MTEMIRNDILQAFNMEPDERRLWAEERLRKLVRFAAQNTKFYAEHYRNIDLEHCPITEIPPTDKKILREHFSDLFSDPDVKTQDLLDFVSNPDNIAQKFLDRYSVITTSGTNGTPLIVLRDEQHDIVHQTILNTRLLRGVDPAILTPIKNRLAAVIAGRSMCSSYTSFMKMSAFYPEYTDNMKAFCLSSPRNELIDGLNSFQPDVLTGYPSVLQILAESQLSGVLKICPKLVVCSAETLTQSAFQSLTAAFPLAALRNNYCSTEGGEIAMSCSEGHLHLNDDWIMLEPVDEQNRPVPDGTRSAGVLVTDLSNRIMPLIRYRLNDRISLSREQCDCGSTLPIITIQGRDSDTLVFGGVAIPSALFGTLIYEKSDVFNWQFLQTGPLTLEFRADYSEVTDRDTVVNNLRKRIKALLASQNTPEVELIFSTLPPKRNSIGGKIKEVIKEWM